MFYTPASIRNRGIEILDSSEANQTADDEVKELVNEISEIKVELERIHERLRILDQAQSVIAVNQMEYCYCITRETSIIATNQRRGEWDSIKFVALSLGVAFLFQGLDVVSGGNKVVFLIGGLLLIAFSYAMSSRRLRNLADIG